MSPSLILFVALGVPPSAEEHPQDSLPGVTIKLVISTDAYDPSEPSTATIKCVAVNKSADPVEVRVGYDSRVNVLRAKGKHLRWDMTLYRFERSGDEPKPIRLKPGEEKVLFELPLDEVFLQRPAPQRKPKWRWDWMARPQAPITPIHRFRERGFAERVTFWAEALVNDKWLSSGDVELKVKPSGGEKSGPSR